MISFFLIARNAENNLSKVLNDILNQDYPKNQMELILVDGRSEDATLEIMNNFKNINSNLEIKILDNPMRILASGWNIALSNSIGEIVLRVDANSRIPLDFIKKNVETMMKGYDIVGGETSTEERGEPGLNLIILAELSKFGGSPASFRNSGRARYVDTLAYAAYRRKVFEITGGYDERLVRTEDNEMHYRMKKAGFKFYYNPEIKSFHVPRSNVYELLKQKYLNGLWIGLTMGIQPRCFSLRHFISLFFVVTLLELILLGLAKIFWYPFIILISTYLILALLFSLESMKKVKLKVKVFCLGLPLVFFLMHFVYGFGTIIGLIKMPYFLWKNNNYKIPFPIKLGAKENLDVQI